MLVAADALCELALRKQVRAAGGKAAGGNDVARRVALHEVARLFDVAHERFDEAHAHGRLNRVGALVGGDAQRNARGTVGVKLDGLFLQHML